MDQMYLQRSRIMQLLMASARACELSFLLYPPLPPNPPPTPHFTLCTRAHVPITILVLIIREKLSPF